MRTKDEKEGNRKASIYNDFVEEYWRKLIHENGDIDPKEEFKLTIKRAKTFGFAYKSVTEISLSPIEEIVDRTLTAEKEIENSEVVSSVLGGKERPIYTLEDLWIDFQSHVLPDLKGKNENQLRKWKNPRIKAWKNFIAVNGDVSVYDIKRDHILDLRAWWSSRLIEEDMSPNSPNKDFTHLRSMLAFAQDFKGAPFNVNDLFSRVQFTETESEKRPFEVSHITNKLLNPINHVGLNNECKLFIYAMADTGARPSELVGLSAKNNDIRLDTEIPYIFIRPDDQRQLKNKYSKRMVPLVGSSLYAFQQLQNGFEDYYLRPDSLSAALNKFLRSHNLLPTENHSVYSLRHSFEDRLTAVEPPDKVQAALMGHKYSRERYGDGPSLAQKHKWLQKIAFRVGNNL